MSCPSAGLTPIRRHAPQADGATLVEPPRAAAAGLLQANIRRLQSQSFHLAGQPATQVRAAAREELLKRAVSYTRQYQATVTTPPADRPIILSGHQPELFHAGVWYKNFVLDQLRQSQAAVGIHLLIDNDLARSVSLRVPGGSPAKVRVHSLLIDQPTAVLPYEERRVVDRALFCSLGQRVTETLGGLVDRPLIAEIWGWAEQALAETENLGQALSIVRHRLEAAWGLQTLELPLSQVCESDPFRRFVVHVLEQLPHFQQLYNQALSEYRHVYRLRSRTHPVPELHEQEGWLEAPFWVWTHQEPIRQALWVRHRAQGMEISADRRQSWVLPRLVAGDGTAAVERLAEWAKAGLRVRPRALTTTMFCRLFLSDLFIHGLGGARYDQLTDLLIHRWFGVCPPEYFCVTATHRLPIPRPVPERAELLRVERQLRDIEFNPDRHLDHDQMSPELLAWVERKAFWIEQDLPRGQRLQRHREITAANRALRPLVAPLRRELQKQRDRWRDALQQEARLASREYPFCLYPASFLRKRLLDDRAAGA